MGWDRMGKTMSTFKKDCTLALEIGNSKEEGRTLRVMRMKKGNGGRRDKQKGKWKVKGKGQGKGARGNQKGIAEVGV